jgi:3-hydroxyisobutyrate dehydrogenase-like beta-hydroxyacid dehydrogenase
VKVAIIGSGPMVRYLPQRLRSSGHQVKVLHYPAESYAGGAEGADLVITLLPDSAAARLVYSELARRASPGQVFVDHSDLDPETAAWCALALPAFLEAPIGERGEIEVRGERAHFERALPVLSAYADPVSLRDASDGRGDPAPA